MFDFFLIFVILAVMKMLNLTTIVWQEGKYFVAQCLNIDVSSFGETKEEATAMLQDALQLYYQDHHQDHYQEIAHPSIETLQYA